LRELFVQDHFQKFAHLATTLANKRQHDELSASVFRKIWESSVLFPPPAAAKMPMRCPSPQVRRPSMARKPREVDAQPIHAKGDPAATR
jgi:hypothetical protein